MSSMEAVTSKKNKQKLEQQQIVSNEITNGCDFEDNESVNSQILTNKNVPDTNIKDCQVDVCMEPLLIQDCVDATNEINETDDLFCDTNNSLNDPLSVCDIIESNNELCKNIANDIQDNSAIIDSGGGFMKANLSLNLKNVPASNEIHELVNPSKIKKFLESDDQIMNQIFFQTITITPTTDEDILLTNSKILNDNNVALSSSETDSDLNIETVNFFSCKIDEDEPFEPNYTDSVEVEGENLCSLNENYCSFSSIDYNTANIKLTQEKQADDQLPENEIPEHEKLICEYADQMLKQRPSIVIDCYDSDSKTEEENVAPANEKKINQDYCFYFDQTIEEDDGDVCYNIDTMSKNTIGKDKICDTEASNSCNEKVNVQEKDDCKDECLEIEQIEISSNDESEIDDRQSTDVDDEGVLNESCLSVNSAIESIESESTKTVKKTVKKSVKTTKTTSKKSSKIISAADSSVTISSKIEKIDNFAEKTFEENHINDTNSLKQLQEQQKLAINSNITKQELSIQESKVDESHQQVEIDTNDTEKRKSNKKKTKKKKADSEKENISVNTSTSIETMSIVSQPSKKPTSASVEPSFHHNHNNLNKSSYINQKICDEVTNGQEIIINRIFSPSVISKNCQKFVMSSSYQLFEDDLSKIDVKSLKEKYSSAIEKHSLKLSSSTGANSIGYLSIHKDISVKHLCRSFGDLSTLNNEDSNTNYFKHVYRTKSVCDLRKLEHIPIYTGVSVRSLRVSYCSLAGLSDINKNQQYLEPQYTCKHFINTIKSSYRGKVINLGVKQFDMKSSFNKFDALQKKNMQSLQNGKGSENGLSLDGEKKCHACEKVVFQMEQIKAEKKFWHRLCFRCVECSKQLNVDTYQSHEGILYCKQHFKTLFSPKIVEDSNEQIKVKKHEMIILENQPIELPPDVVRSSDKADLGLDELHQINLRQRFQLFENAGQQESKVELDKANNVKRSSSILSKLARFQAKGMDVGVVDDSLNGISYENSSTEEEDEDELDDENHEDIELIRAKRAQKEKPMSFKEMYDIKSKFESGQLMNKEERREERKQELQNIRSRLFMGKQAKIKEMYQQAVAESEQTITSSSKKSDVEIGDKAKSIMEKFEKGEIFDENDLKKTLHEDEMAVFEKGFSKQSRSLFLELDATASKSPNQDSSPLTNLKLTTRHTPRENSQTIVTGEDVIRSDQKVDDVQIETADIVSKFKFFEAYQPPEKEKKSFRITPPRDYQGLTKLSSPEKEVYRDPHIARNEKRSTDQDEILELQKTTSKVLSMFRQMEENKEEKPYGPKPLKRFTPPPESERGRFVTNDDSGPDYSDEDEDEECSEEESEEEPNYIKSSQKNLDEFLKAAQSVERAKKLREKFEKWEENEIKKEMNNSSINLYDEEQDEGQMETAKSLKARFEQMQNEEPKLPTNRPKVNRFV